MVKRLALVVTASSLLLGGAGMASAEVIASLAFTNPTGIVGPNDVLPVFLKLTLDPTSDALITDSSSAVTSPLFSAADIAAHLFTVDGNPIVDPNSLDLSKLTIFVNEAAGCVGALNACNGPLLPYRFDFNFGPDPLAFVTPANFDLQPGGSYTWQIGTFTPQNGPVADGTYDFPYANLSFYVYDSDLPDPNNSNGTNIATILLADTQRGPAFERTVVSESPEPGTWMLMLSGLFLAGGAVRRKVKATAA